MHHAPQHHSFLLFPLLRWYNMLINVNRNAFCRPLASDKSDFLQIEYPGVDNLGKTEKGNLNDKIKSYSCVKKT